MSEIKGKVIPFRQGAAFYNKRGMKEMGKNDLVGALYQFRRAYQDDPANAETCLSMAEILSQMQRFEESNRILFGLLSKDEPAPEILFGLACNFFGIHEFEYAAQCLEQYLEREPDGAYAYEAEDFLDFLEDDDAMGESTGLFTDEDYDTDGAVIESRHLMDSLDMSGAIAILEEHISRYPRSTRAKNQLALAYYCNGERNRAIRLANEVLESNGNDPQALCNSALFLHSIGDDVRAQEALKTVRELASDDAPEVLHNVSVLQLEFKLFPDALKTLLALEKLMPYDENVVHKLGYCRFMLGDFDQVLACYKKLLRINPEDTIAKYYFSVCKRNDSHKSGTAPRWCIPYQVPFAEAFRRLNQINRTLAEPPEKQLALWKTDAHFRSLVTWALDLPENRAKNAMLSLVFSYGDEHTERILRDFLLRTDQPDDAKRIVFGMLKRLKAREPFMAYLNGDWVTSRVSMIEYPEKLTPCYENVLEQLITGMAGERGEKEVAAAVAIFKVYLARNADHLPRLTLMQEAAMAAALELLGCRIAEAEVSEEDICKKYRVSARRLHNAIEKLTPPEGES